MRQALASKSTTWWITPSQPIWSTKVWSSKRTCCSLHAILGASLTTRHKSLITPRKVRCGCARPLSLTHQTLPSKTSKESNRTHGRALDPTQMATWPTITTKSSSKTPSNVSRRWKLTTCHVRSNLCQSSFMSTRRWAWGKRQIFRKNSCLNKCIVVNTTSFWTQKRVKDTI